MVRSLLAGRKSQDRVLIEPQASCQLTGDKEENTVWQQKTTAVCPYGKAGDLLYVKEKLKLVSAYHPLYRESVDAYYEATGKTERLHWDGSLSEETISPDAMPRFASRLTLEITDVRAERLQDITKEDAIAEGLQYHPLYKEWGGVEAHPASRPEYPQWRWYDSPIEAYKYFWQSINGRKSWELNPWVWVISFNTHKQNVDDFIKGK